MTVVWWNRDGRFVEDEHAEAVLERNASGYAFFQYRCDQADREAFQIEYFETGGRPRRTACIPGARLDAVRAKYGFTFIAD